MTYIKLAAQFDGFESSFAAKLEQFNIRHIEQLASLLVSPTGEEGLRRLRLKASIEDIRSATKKYLRTLGAVGLRLTPSETRDPERPSNRYPRPALGFTTPLQSIYQMFAEVPPAAVEKATNGANSAFHNLLTTFEKRGLFENGMGKLIYADGRLPPVKHQGARGTCVAFATTAMLEAYIQKHVPRFKRTTDFSEQYLYYRAKQVDANHSEDGTHFQHALDALKNHGVCSSAHLPYRTYNDWSHSLLFEDSTFKRNSLIKLASGTRISGYMHLPFYDIVAEIKHCLDRKLAVGVGVLVFQDAWYENDYSVMTGEITLPMIEEDSEKEVLLDVCRGGHAITIYGYEEKPEVGQTESERPGGGGFIFRNSWGPDWGFNNDYSRGYGIIPYSYIEKYATDACIITGLAS